MIIFWFCPFPLYPIISNPTFFTKPMILFIPRRRKITCSRSSIKPSLTSISFFPQSSQVYSCSKSEDTEKGQLHLYKNKSKYHPVFPTSCQHRLHQILYVHDQSNIVLPLHIPIFFMNFF